MPQPPSDQPPRPATDPHDKLLEKVERLSEFGAQMAATLRGEFIYFWDRADRRAEVPESTAFVTKVDALRNLTARYLREVARCKHLPPVQATHVIRTLDLGELLEAGRGLEATSRVLREKARERGWSSGRLGSRQNALPWTDQDGWVRLFSGVPLARGGQEEKPKGGWLTGRLQAMVERIPILPVAQQKVEGPPPPPPPGVRRLQAFESALDLVKDLLEESEPRMATLRAAAIEAGAYKRDIEPGARLAKVPAELRPLVAEAARAIANDPAVRRNALVAISQWEHAAKLMLDFERAREAARKVPPEQVGQVLQPFQIDKLKGLIMPLTNLHMTFRGVAGVAPMFPPPVSRKIEINVPTSEAARRSLNKPDEQEESAADGEEKEDDEPLPTFSPDETSKRRLGLIMTYLTDPDSVPELADETMVFRLVAEEHAYQEDRVIDLGMRLRLLPDDASNAKRDALTEALDEARQNKAHLQELLSFVASTREGGGG